MVRFSELKGSSASRSSVGECMGSIDVHLSNTATGIVLRNHCTKPHPKKPP